ncbi:single-stranded DNA-binding protein [Clostridium tyrobutyricum]|uniref:single-stranded DNA-binding protein n=1 Tax=Clostridium tyrobutyricum TaxID=1519 RepID=UPI001C390CFE|nr:single-stranded DNA-binding protein [Clostridium tyrobutyricum]MBV4417174.1 single-stranded DNA-binding protein [Clostridium tyrobutyricum]
MNNVNLIGRFTKDPELRFTPGQGKPVTTFTLAVDRRKKDEADFIRVVAWGKTAESIANYMKKGRLIGITGSIRTGSYEGKDGTKRYTTDVVASQVQFLDYGKKDENAGTANSARSEDIEGITPVDDGDIPF